MSSIRPDTTRRSVPDEDFAVIETSDGSSTAFSTRFSQAYSSRHGARSQAETVFVRGTATDQHPSPRVLEVGFGLGHNFRATLGLRRPDAPLEYLAFELFPVPSEILGAITDNQDPLWKDTVQAWSAFGTESARAVSLHVSSHGRTLTVRHEDVSQTALPVNWASAIYLDGFSPRVNPELWTPEFCVQLALALASGGRLATYSAAGHVRRALVAAGLEVEKRSGLTGKREFLVARKP
ncbi:tRNA (5-methylaminomethyl-2-thiouridine)(34)-methyltransferase MnmD [Deinococcus peraridilitoris]|uniref:MnmC-like methyltransferase domain-containing protein n=1 Tax=Deinococcus peraridilitoris (strain DSM 19664 / LMG 22246 / CIP 109416 / KR-200) TaxID=937777 RepID=L0A5S6_DEIPD|nr:tRNA (5-methylaminomethyl-2-thiouridine)(34)-methyltransferase MnmD [Deinococcus peraridilitoris]AFZ69233.1 hypothetical protein Deipe_3809 [Deinococcus peraridilitoris DSM 19664]